jgi:cytochrome c oxidase cbb3-type subunit 3
MPHFNGSLSPEKLDALLAFLPRWSDPKLGAEARAAGLKAYAGVCAACHGAEGHGNPALGAPNLTDTVWLWGGEREQIRQTLLFGRINHMPAHDKLISPGEIRVVAGYVYGLSREP